MTYGERQVVERMYRARKSCVYIATVLGLDVDEVERETSAMTRDPIANSRPEVVEKNRRDRARRRGNENP